MHTRDVRALALMIVIGAPRVVHAYMPAPPPGPPPPSNVWERALDPRSPSVIELTGHLAVALRTVEEPWTTDRHRVEIIARALRAARHVLSQDPDGASSLYYAGAFADLAGEAEPAERWLTAVIQAHPRSEFAADARRRLAGLALRRGRAREAIALARSTGDVARPRVDQFQDALVRAYAYESLGDAAAAVDELAPFDTGDEGVGVAAALHLAALYDRDDQQTRAFETLTRLRLQSPGEAVNSAIRGFPPPVAADQIYLRALAADVDVEARAVVARRLWHQYERSGGAPATVARARAHREQIDRELISKRRPARPRQRP